jgi:cytochrome subunit of sulfide dehydrogenase
MAAAPAPRWPTPAPKLSRKEGELVGANLVVAPLPANAVRKPGDHKGRPYNRVGNAAMKARHAFMIMLVCAGMTPAAAAEAPSGAASCTGCHAEKQNVNTPVPRLAGQDESAIVAAMQAYRGGQRPATVMDRIARGYSDDEIVAIAAWFAMQR